jgi:sec-independent protein translocase protein TatA
MNSPSIAAFGVSGTELLVIFGIIILLFGATKIPALARSLGQAKKEFKKASREDEEDQAAGKKNDSDKTGSPH